MQPTIRQGQVLMVKNYGGAAPQRGDIILFHPPATESDLPDLLVKRVIAVPGDTITVTDSAVNVNGKVLAEPYVAPENAGNGGWDPQYYQLTLQAKQYYVLGDNRKSSIDSRLFGPIPLTNIEGKIVSTA